MFATTLAKPGTCSVLSALWETEKEEEMERERVERLGNFISEYSS